MDSDDWTDLAKLAFKVIETLNEDGEIVGICWDERLLDQARLTNEDEDDLKSLQYSVDINTISGWFANHTLLRHPLLQPLGIITAYRTRLHPDALLAYGYDQCSNCLGAPPAKKKAERTYTAGTFLTSRRSAPPARSGALETAPRILAKHSRRPLPRPRKLESISS